MILEFTLFVNMRHGELGKRTSLLSSWTTRGPASGPLLKSKWAIGHMTPPTYTNVAQRAQTHFGRVPAGWPGSRARAIAISHRETLADGHVQKTQTLFVH